MIDCLLQLSIRWRRADLRDATNQSTREIAECIWCGFISTLTKIDARNLPIMAAMATETGSSRLGSAEKRAAEKTRSFTMVISFRKFFGCEPKPVLCILPVSSKSHTLPIALPSPPFYNDFEKVCQNSDQQIRLW